MPQEGAMFIVRPPPSPNQNLITIKTTDKFCPSIIFVFFKYNFLFIIYRSRYLRLVASNLSDPSLRSLQTPWSHNYRFLYHPSHRFGIQGLTSLLYPASLSCCQTKNNNIWKIWFLENKTNYWQLELRDNSFFV